MTNRELSQAIRKDLKEHGITSKDVSVRVRDALYDTSVNITIKNPLVRETDVESITRKYSKVDYDQRSMEDLKLERAVNNMKEIILTDQEARQVDTFLEFTSSRITEELKLWESLKVYTENAEKNVEFWKSTAQAVNRLRVQLL